MLVTQCSCIIKSISAFARRCKKAIGIKCSNYSQGIKPIAVEKRGIYITTPNF